MTDCTQLTFVMVWLFPWCGRRHDVPELCGEDQLEPGSGWLDHGQGQEDCQPGRLQLHQVGAHIVAKIQGSSGEWHSPYSRLLLPLSSGLTPSHPLPLKLPVLGTSVIFLVIASVMRSQNYAWRGVRIFFTRLKMMTRDMKRRWRVKTDPNRTSFWTH